MTTDRRPERLAALRHRLAEGGLAELVVAHPANIRYLTGFSGSSGLVLVTAEVLVLVTDFRYETQAAEETEGAARVEIAPSGLVEALRARLEALGTTGPTAFEDHVFTVREAAKLREGAADGRFRRAPDLVEGLRAVKAPEEIAAIRDAGRVAGEALASVVGEIRVGLSELEVAALLETALRRAGSEAHPFPTIVASGPRAALPHARTSARRVGAGEWLLLDFGAQVGGYCADVTRTFMVGAAPDARQREVYGVVREAQAAALAGLRAGMTGRAGDALARDRIAAAGFGAAFGHSLGHGLGLEVHEAPRVSKASEEPLAAGAVVTVEPGVYLPGWGGVRIEDDVALGAEGATLLTDIPRELVVLG
jgi:Xaa-Pro aminopeptidase